MVEVLEKGNVRKGGTQSKYSMVNISWMCQIWTSAVKLGQGARVHFDHKGVLVDPRECSSCSL